MARLTMLRPRLGMLRTGVTAAPIEVLRMSSRPWARLRAAVLSDDPLCVHCRREGRVSEATEVDHRVPLWRGGSNDLSNLDPICGPCHAEKTAREAAQRAQK